MSDMEITPETFTADYVGTPGHRTFYLQSRGAGGIRTFDVEKQQVAILAEKLRELLLMVDESDAVRSATPARDPGLGLEEPLEAEWRVGAMGLAYDEQGDRVVLFAQPVEAATVEEAEPEAAVEELAETGVRFLLRRDQVRSFVLHAYAIVEEGRATCQLCGLPIDPEGHDCPASNGHRVMS